MSDQEQKPRVKLSEATMTPAAQKAIFNATAQRLQNLNQIAREGGYNPVNNLLGELVMIEVKMDAVLMMLDAQGADFSKFAEYMENAAKQNQAVAASIAQQMNGPRIVR